MVSERAAGVVRAKQSALLQDRHDLIDEIIEGAGKPGRHQIEPVRRPRDEPFLKAVGHELRCPAQQPMSHGGRGEVTQLPQRHVVLPGKRR